jgi:hypothetical protein
MNTEITPSAQHRVKGTPVWQKASNTFGYLVASPKTSWRTYGTKAERKAFRKECVAKPDWKKQERINEGSAIIHGLCASHIHARKPQ